MSVQNAMKYIFPFLLLFLIFALDASAQIRGTLQKSSGRPLPYTEIELVPTDSKRIVMNGSLFATSSASGKFTFVKVPPGSYTLSVNFDDKPTDLSPFPTVFYPNTSKRDEAEVFEITESSPIKTVIFKLPPPLVQRKIAGNAVFSNGTPVIGARIGLRDIAFDRSVGFGIAKTDANGNFSVTGFNGREYQLGALLFEREPKTIYDSWGAIIAAGESKIFALDANTPVIKFTVRQSEDVEKIRDKYVADLIWENNNFSR